MIGDYKEAMDLHLLQVKDMFGDDEKEVVGIFATENDIEVAKKLYLDAKEESGRDRDEFGFFVSKYTLGDINY